MGLCLSRELFRTRLLFCGDGNLFDYSFGFGNTKARDLFGGFGK